ncbi:MFS transporter [Candidatus Wolfebacteria bacterium]|nr:MFS transporter [Candidatus Wolfebacteria bacterium]
MHIFSKNLWTLFGSRLFTHSGLSIMGVFLPTFIYLEYGGSLYAVILTFILGYSIHLLLIPLAAKLLKPVGMKKLMILALVPFLVVALGALSLWDQAPTLMLAIYIVSWAAYRALYWVPYHVEVTTFLDEGHRGRQVSFFTNLVAVSAIITPLAGGFIIQFWGFQWIFIVGLVLVALSVIPLLFMEETHEEYTFSYKDSITELFAKKNRNLLYAYAGDGAQGVVALVFWPIFIYLILDGNFAAVGAVSSLVIVATIVLSAFAGEWVDRMSRTQLLMVSTVIYTTGWFLKSFATTALHIFLFDAYQSAGKAVNRITFDAGSYTHLADNGHYVDEYTAFKEMALNIGRILMLIFAGFLAVLFGIKVAFILAAFASLTMVLINGTLKKHASSH